MAKISGRLIGILIVFLIFCNINIVFGRKYDRYIIEVENEYDRVQSTTVPTVTEESSSLFDTLPKTEEVIASQSIPKDNTVQEEKETEDDVFENQRKSNSTMNQIKGHHQYYNSTIVVDKERVEAHWNKIRNIPASKMLSHSHRRAMIVTLSFDFPFYGYLVRNVTVAPTGFIYIGDYVHSWLAATQYIAPLTADFDTSLSNDSFVRLNDTGSSFTVIWENVYLPDQQDVGKFAFSTTLHKNGDIVFTYFSVPILPKSILADKHSVQVGLSDAYIIDKVVYFARRKTIYEYHRVDFANADITNYTIITLKALPTCLEYTDCVSCVNHVTAFNCSWCPTVNRCSSGLDRQRQDWIEHGCDQHNVTEEDSCPANVSETFTTEEAVVASEATLITSVTTNSSQDSVEKEEDSLVTDNPSDSKEQKEEETDAVVASEATLITSVTTNSSEDSVEKEEDSFVTANSNDATVRKKEDITKEKNLNTEDVTENTTLKTFEKNNLIVIQTKNHDRYYNITFVVDQEKTEAYWNEIRNMQPNRMLSQSHRKLLPIVLSFDFPFYGYLVRNVTVAPTGFIYIGDYVHSWLAATQYIAPLTADFDTSLSNDSFVRLNDTGSSFTVIWENVYLPDQQDVGKFAFSTTLHKNGDIVFTYFSVPILPKSILADKHSVQVGLSDAYIIDKVVYFARRKTIYEYHKIDFANADITNSTIITLKALPTCLEYTDCVSCVNHVTAFNCSWCPTVNRCSSGLDRQRQDWIEHGCDQHNVTEEDSCPANVSETFTTEEAVVASEATLITSVTTNSSQDSVEKEEDSFVTDNPGDSTEQKEEETAVTANSNDDTVKKEEDITTTLKTSEKNNLTGNHSKDLTMNPISNSFII